jgi:hypothetical protein
MRTSGIPCENSGTHAVARSRLLPSPSPCPQLLPGSFVGRGVFRPLGCNLEVILFIHFVGAVLKPDQIPFVFPLQQISDYTAPAPIGDVANRLNVITRLECRHRQNYMTVAARNTSRNQRLDITSDSPVLT